MVLRILNDKGVNLADTQLENGYNSTIGKIWATPAGSLISKIMAFIAVVLVLCMIVAIFLRVMNRAPGFYQKFVGNGKVIAGNLAGIAFFSMPAFLIPTFFKAFDWFASFVGTTGNDFITASIMTPPLGVVPGLL